MTPEIADADTLKVLSAIFMFAGTVLVSWRVTTILEAHSLAIEALDLNEQIQQEIRLGRKIPNIRMYGMHGQVKKAEKVGIRLLICGFLMQIIGVACNVMSFFI